MPAFLDAYNARPNALPEGSDSPEQRARTLQWWNTEVDGVGHPDWVLYTCDRVTPSYYQQVDGRTSPNMPLDLTNPAVVEWQVQDIGIGDDSQQFYNALSADLVYLRNFDGACGIYRDGEWVQLFTGEEEDPAYAEAVVTWASRMSNALHALPSPRWLVANFPPFDFYSDEEITTLTANLDGVLDEAGFTGFGRRINMSGEAWIKKVRNILAIQGQGVAYYSMNYVQSFPPVLEELDWILASYLMAKEHSAYVLVTEVGGIRWPDLAEYQQNVGHPCSPMRFSQNVYVRDYSRGMVVVNPSWSSAYSFTLPDENFFDLHDAPILDSTLFLPTVSGKVLLSALDRCS